MIRYVDSETGRVEDYPLKTDGRHVDQSLNARSLKKSYSRVVSAPLLMPLSEYQIPQFQAHVLPVVMPRRTVNLEVSDIPLFSAMWLNNPDFSK